MQPPSISQLHAELSKRFGFRIPAAFAQFIHHALAESTKEGYYDYYGFLGYYQFFDFNMPVKIDYDHDTNEWIYPKNESYESYYSYGIPPELCMFGSMDSLRFGYIVHDPSLQQEEWPVGKVAEMDFGVIKYGDNTREGLESLIAWLSHKYRKFGKENESYAIKAVEKHQTLAELLGLKPKPGKIAAEVSEGGTYDMEKPVHAVPVVPAGWRYEPAIDGIGVLAPAKMFASSKIDELEDTADVEKLIAEKHYATALLTLRETLWKNWHSNSDPFYEECAILMKDVYIKMGRPMFAHRVQQQIDYMRTLNF